MEVNKKINGGELTIAPKGSLDTVTTPDLEKEIGDLENLNSLIIDCKDLDYVSSSGLRLFLKLHKSLSLKGGLKLVNVPPLIKEIFDITRFSDVLTIELA